MESELNTWAHMLGLTDAQLFEDPAPYHWNAVLAYVANLGWGLQRDLTDAQYAAGQDLFRYTHALINVPYRQGGPITLPGWMTPPGIL